MFKVGDVVRRKAEAWPSMNWVAAKKAGISTLVVKRCVEEFGSQGFVAHLDTNTIDIDTWWASDNFELIRPTKLNLRDYL